MGLQSLFAIVVKRRNVVLLLLAVTTATSGCLSNTGSQGASKGTSSSAAGSGFGGTTGGELPSSNSESFITVSDVLRSNADPNTMIELLGSQSEIGTQCPTVNDCVCVFEWTESSGIRRETEQVPSYVETNMIRCLFTQVTADASYFDVRIRIKAADEGSNTKRVTLTSQNPSLDSSIAANYSVVQRYICRDLLGKNANSRFYKNNLVDPRLWTSEYSLAFNFYTTSFGADYGAVAIAGTDGSVTPVPGYECPLIPNNIAEQPIYDLKLYSLNELNLNDPTNPNVPLGTGDSTIYPPDDNQNIQAARCPTGAEPTCEKYLANRHDYYLASFKSGTYKQPVCLFHRVSNITSGQALDCTIDETKGTAVIGSVAVGKDVIGFAAVPDANQKCPDINTVKIPAGKKWAKLWQFRASYRPRTIPDVASPGDIGDLFCTNREQECMSTDASAGGVTNSVCYNARFAIGPQIGPQQTFQLTGNCDSSSTAGDGRGDDPGGLYDSFLGGEACIANNVNCCMDLNNSGFNATNRPANFTDGGNFCNPALIGDNDASSVAVGANHPAGEGGLAQDIWLMGNGSKQACIEADTDALGALKLKTFPPAKISNPYGDLQPREIETDSRSDLVYVVTPESVKFEDMQDAENGAIARQYTPYRLSTDGVTKIAYRLDSDSLNTNDPLQRLSRFPLCVLQDAKKGANGANP